MYNAGREPDFNNLAAVLEKRKPKRPVLFDFIMGGRLERMLAGDAYDDSSELALSIARAAAFRNAGFDFAPIIVRGLTFSRHEQHTAGAQTKSLNAGAAITDRETFNRYEWPEVERCDFSIIRSVGDALAKGMKLIPFSLDGVLENAISIAGYENLCIMLYEDRELVSDIFENVGSRLLKYFERCLAYEAVGAILQNDDWGFNTQPMLSPKDLREFVFPWHKRMAEAAHKKGRYAILHSCGNYESIIGDVINDIKVDGRHSYQDNILPVEEAYGQLRGKIAVLGGMDVDFLARATQKQVYQRCTAMLERSRAHGGYALGSGNSLPDYIPQENSIAMFRAARDYC